MDKDDFTDQTLYQEEHLKDLYSTRSKIRQEFLDRFYSEYLATLRQRHAYDQEKYSDKAHVREGDVCLIHHEKPRKFWNLGLVMALKEGQDGNVRVAEIKTANGITNRAIKKLYPIGLNHPIEISDKIPQKPDSDNENELDLTPATERTRPQRRAATAAKQKLAQLFQTTDSDSE